MTDLADTIVALPRGDRFGQPLSAIRLNFDDASDANTLRQVLLGAGVQDVEVVSEAERQRRWSGASTTGLHCCWSTTRPRR